MHKKDIDTLIISDIHLGNKLSRIKELQKVLSGYNCQRLILNGDIFDGLNFKRLPSAHWGVLSYFRKLSKTKEVVWINGNHDGAIGILSNLLGVKVYKQYLWECNGKKYLAIHGHQFDRFLHKSIIISSMAVYLYNLIQKIDSKNKLLSNFVKKHSHSWLRMSEEVAKGAVRYARLRRANYIFCGHTHIAKYYNSGDIEYYNSGSWTEVPSSFIAIDKNKAEIVKVC
ncbi:UDP-2,3-diacylglucosamine diphosphatase [Candidatus Falkowbacteria bacterium CG_4_10_14_0_2_um_filter_36_22]|uniref:UDP-2,3-diacylglucosamine diphosphatase n=1 Tax=Candidatus Falkowbacteria bacterium CG02_land_8_20_14_3_00_36_14 TaxID=1974560 RepID=A0A2M7DP76_9BACT|nr:MAG: UDP-2,3-diacylglucosamine diphosphatase [Candidatus Falkowbacteria bacterium CG02_land_8_20_14_3_00_36_14]PIX11273.1 MAG: UDP-2,3-diacylglucosamine diphosphatase [Candidatus Falkowbacteria bacterium CG_4_8_14_3_um_filter_36_11]PJA11105.1 MAG: UDP-2,3-diacylglucosamine diphosphatase [Candidatus Falkowbacteria bacterium CG_4_10_14_0_2_um_filter_36_22]